MNSHFHLKLTKQFSRVCVCVVVFFSAGLLEAAEEPADSRFVLLFSLINEAQPQFRQSLSQLTAVIYFTVAANSIQLSSGVQPGRLCGTSQFQLKLTAILQKLDIGMIDCRRLAGLSFSQIACVLAILQV